VVSQKNKRNLVLASAGAAALWFFLGKGQGEGQGEGSGAVGGTDPLGGGVSQGNYIDDYGTFYPSDPSTEGSLLSQTPSIDNDPSSELIGGQTFATNDMLYPPAPLTTELAGLGVMVGSTVGANVAAAGAKRAGRYADEVGESILERRQSREAAIDLIKNNPKKAEIKLLSKTDEAFSFVQVPAVKPIARNFASLPFPSKVGKVLKRGANALPYIDAPIGVELDLYFARNYPQNAAEAAMTRNQAIAANAAGEAAQAGVSVSTTVLGAALGSVFPVAGTAAGGIIGNIVGQASGISADIAATEAVKKAQGMPSLFGTPTSPEERQRSQEYVGFLLNAVPADPVATKPADYLLADQPEEFPNRANNRRQVMASYIQSVQQLQEADTLPNEQSAQASFESNKLGYDPANPFNVKTNASQLQSRALTTADRKETTNAEKGRQKANTERLAEVAKQKAAARANALRTFGGQYGSRRVNASSGRGFTIYSRTAGRSSQFAETRARNRSTIRNRNSAAYGSNN